MINTTPMKERKEEPIEDLMFPGNGTLTKDSEGTLHSTIVDMELDPIECTFNNDRCVAIDTKDLSYIVLDTESLQRLIELIEEAEDHYES